MCHLPHPAATDGVGGRQLGPQLGVVGNLPLQVLGRCGVNEKGRGY